MARVIYGGGVTEFIGSIGGTTFQSNASGFIVRQLPKVPKIRTGLQVEQLTDFTYYSQLYRDLTIGEQTDWANFASANPHVNYWNETKIVNGLHWFITINTLRVKAGDTVTGSPPAYDLPTSFPTATLNINEFTIDLDSASPLGDVGETLFIWSTSGLTSNVALPRKLLKLIMITGAASGLPIDLASAWETVFGGTVANKLFNPDNKLIVCLTKTKTGFGIPLPFDIVRS